MPDFSLLQMPNFAQAALGGYQAGQAVRQQNERQAALTGYAANPDDPVAVQRLAVADPSLGVPVLQQNQRQRQIADLSARAQAGDTDAAHQLYGIAPEIAQHFDTQTQAKLAAGQKAVGEAALRVSLLPDAQIPAAADQVIDELSPQFPNLAQYKGVIKTRADLNRVIDQAGLTKEDMENHTPKYQAIAPGGGLGQTNPNAGPVGWAPGMAPQNTGGAPAQPKTKADLDALPNGTHYIAPDGTQWIKGGAGPQTPLTFR